MSKIIWTVTRYAPTSVNVTDSVLSFNYTQGRQNYLDPYSGGTLTMTLDNSANVAQYFTFNSVWSLTDVGVSFDGEQKFWCQGIVFNDYPGNTGLSTITVSLVDVIARNGRNVVSSVVLTQTDTSSQLQNLWTTSPYQIGNIGGTGAGSSQAAGITYTGSMSNYLNLITTTERGQINFYDGTVGMIPRNSVGLSDSGCSFTRNSSSATAISYNAYTHDRANLNFMNNVTVSPGGLASQTATNSTSVAAYGNAQQTITTVDATTTQALGLARYLSESQASPDNETYTVSFTDLIQDSSALETFLNAFYSPTLGLDNRVWTLVSRVPGAGSDTSTSVVIEGINVSATPEQTVFTVFLSPLAYYQIFTLDSNVLGVLDVSRFGW